MTEEEQPPNLAERYTTLVSTSNLRVEAERRTPGDMMIAAGMNRHRLGMALLRLASEWDGTGKPPPPNAETIEAMAKNYPRIEGAGLVAYEGEHLAPLVAAKREAEAWHAHELGLLFQRLKTLPEVRAALVYWATGHDIEGPEHVVAAVLKWWLDQICPVCHGVKKKVIAGTGRTSSKNCHACRGSGERRIPHGWMGRKMVAYMDECLKAATSDLRRARQNLRAMKRFAAGHNDEQTARPKKEGK